MKQNKMMEELEMRLKDNRMKGQWDLKKWETCVVLEEQIEQEKEIEEMQRTDSE